MKQDRQDIINHFKISSQVKKSKNQNEIMQGATLIFDTGNANGSSGKGNRKGRKNK